VSALGAVHCSTSASGLIAAAVYSREIRFADLRSAASSPIMKHLDTPAQCMLASFCQILFCLAVYLPSASESVVFMVLYIYNFICQMAEEKNKKI